MPLSAPLKKWISDCKAYAAKHNCSYKQAMSALKKLKKSRKSYNGGGHSDLNGSSLTEAFTGGQEGNMNPVKANDASDHNNLPVTTNNSQLTSPPPPSGSGSGSGSSSMSGGSGMSQFEVGNQNSNQQQQQQTGGKRRRRRSASNKSNSKRRSQSQSGGKGRKSRRGRRRSSRGGSLSYSQY